MHVVIAPLLIRAKLYASGLGLSDSQWSAITDPDAIATANGKVLHLLPGLDPVAVPTAIAVANRLGARVVDHCS